MLNDIVAILIKFLSYKPNKNNQVSVFLGINP